MQSLGCFNLSLLFLITKQWCTILYILRHTYQSWKKRLYLIRTFCQNAAEPDTACTQPLQRILCIAIPLFHIISDILRLSSTSSSLEHLAQYTESIHNKVLELVAKVVEVGKGCTVQHIRLQVHAKLPEVEDVSLKFNQIAKEQLLQCTGWHWMYITYPIS